MNRIIIIGRLVQDPESFTTASGVNFCKFRVAVNRNFKHDEADFFQVSAWRELGKNCYKYLRKGNCVAVSGRLNMTNYEQEGVKKLSVDIVADEVEFLSPKEDKDEKQNEFQELNFEAGDMPF